MLIKQVFGESNAVRRYFHDSSKKKKKDMLKKNDMLINQMTDSQNF